MRVHHLNCGTLCPLAQRLVNGEGSPLRRGRLVCHCLLVESSEGLVLVDTGFGLADGANPVERLGRPFLAMTRPSFDPGETAIRQLERRGVRPEEIRHIVVTHLDPDHAGGLADFPQATVHLWDREHEAAMARVTRLERSRYRSSQWAHGPRWNLHAAGGERWLGFQSVRAIGDGEILLIPLPGHTRGHAAVAVQDGEGWLLHCGDGYFFRGEIADDPARCPVGLRLFQRLMAVDDELRLENRQRLRQLARSHGREVRLFSAHDPVELEQMALSSPTAAVNVT